LFFVWNAIVANRYEKNPTRTFLVSQIGYLLIGVLYTWLLFKIISWTDRNKPWPWNEIIFTLSLLILAIFLGFIKVKLPFMNIGTSDNDLTYSAVPFLIPYVLLKSWDFWQTIPEKRFHAWKYPTGMEPPIIMPSGQVTLKVNLETIKDGEKKIQPFRKYDLDLNKTLGEHLHFLLYDFPNSPDGYPIPIADPVTNDSYKWIFKSKPYLLLPQKVLDFRVPVKDLNLRTGMIIDIEIHEK